ncbi:L-rhamnose mutarotase [Hymenobacter armeniacus]|uniref:L-rhamnose mutarotase n=1 Tax=Hymenobacter armeniacus TaxID=2771358 RepID=A0ABR8JTN4_9BACT|nr:L-rhamnose mutarotase [Hymenobacter armeniacus]MBD2722133.1 L-rhamnose mutarotase [Hymenobacter armeniacus]
MSISPENLVDVATHRCVSLSALFGRFRSTTRRKDASLHRARIRRSSRFLVLLLLLLLAISAFAQAGEKMSVIEIIGPGKAPVSARNLVALCRKYKVPTSGIYRWQNHLIAYGKTASIQALQKNLAAVYTGSEVKLYAVPFYKFDRQHCTDKTTAKQWDNIILTANLVKDSKKQQEYLNHHATQFQQWPEVAQGFCRASFQQLLVFRQGRQLMLVISIPHGASLDELNPKTSLNNPRVNDWNALMKQYQEGLPGTKPGEVWVFLKPAVALKQQVLLKK